MKSEYFVNIVFSVPVQSFVYNVKKRDKAHSCGTPVAIFFLYIIHNSIYSIDTRKFIVPILAVHE